MDQAALTRSLSRNCPETTQVKVSEQSTLEPNVQDSSFSLASQQRLAQAVWIAPPIMKLLLYLMPKALLPFHTPATPSQL